MILFTILFSCGSSKRLINEDYSRIRFNEKVASGSTSKTQDYIFEVPKGGKLSKGSYDFTGDYHTEYRIMYPDSSILYIGNDNWSGSKLNVINRVEAGIRGINKRNENDSLYFEGVQKNGRYWKENFLGDIIVGYVNVKQEDKEKYDKSVQSIRPNK